MALLTFPMKSERLPTQRYSVEYDGKLIIIAFLGYVQPAPVLEQGRAARIALAA